MHTIEHNLNHIKTRIEQACKRSGRNLKEVRLLLATKTVDTERIKYAIGLGETLIGENKVQELKQKCPDLVELQPEVHFIGHLQSNKIKDVLKWAHCIQSVDRISIAQKLQQRLEFEDRHIDVYIQVNTSFEESKFGVHPDHAIELIKAISKLDRLHIKGLMTIGLLSTESNKVRGCFKTLKHIQNQVKALDIPNVDLKELSMGMSGDLEIAIEEGATIVRVGTAIFGERIYPDSYYWDETK